MPHRIEQTESAIRRGVAKVLAEGLADPRYKGLVTVTRVKIDESNGHATVGVSVMPQDAGKTTLAAIEHAASFIRREVGNQIRTRRMPTLGFHLDDSLKREAEVLGAIHQAMAEAESPPQDETRTDGTAPIEPDRTAQGDEPQ